MGHPRGARVGIGTRTAPRCRVLLSGGGRARGRGGSTCSPDRWPGASCTSTARPGARGPAALTSAEPSARSPPSRRGRPGDSTCSCAARTTPCGTAGTAPGCGPVGSRSVACCRPRLPWRRGRPGGSTCSCAVPITHCGRSRSQSVKAGRRGSREAVWSLRHRPLRRGAPGGSTCSSAAPATRPPTVLQHHRQLDRVGASRRRADLTAGCGLSGRGVTRPGCARKRRHPLVEALRASHRMEGVGVAPKGSSPPARALPMPVTTCD
jgi:hypothetical protein